MEEYSNLSLGELDNILDKLTKKADKLCSLMHNQKQDKTIELKDTESRIHCVIECMKLAGDKFKNTENVYFV